MSRRSKLLVVILVIVVVSAAAQLIRPDRTNPSTDPTKTIAATTGQELTGGTYERAR